MRINKEFDDGEICTVTLKDRFKPQEEAAKLWYDRAFGPLRNMMKVELSFTPPPADVTPGTVIFFAKINYAMFPEMKEGEFKDEEEKYMYNDFIPLESETDESGVVDYYLELELPYGTYSPQIFLKEINAKDASGDGSSDP